jgi:folate-binding protein YgfZ
LYDAFLYNYNTISPDEPKDGVILECDASLGPKLLKHLALFRVRKAVSIEPLDESETSLWVVYDSGHKYVNVTSPNGPIEFPLIDSCCAPVSPLHSSKREELPILKEVDVDVKKDKKKIEQEQASAVGSLHQFGDPRLPQLGWRVLMTKGRTEFPTKQVIKVVQDESGYQELRYSVGVAEGAEELPHAGCFPLECNGDYVHGISFQKGCYIGQELTARTHHTGVVRKRIMPFRYT